MTMPDNAARVAMLQKQVTARGVVSFLLDHNPCFLVSAVCMFLGCYLLNSAIDARPTEVAKQLGILGTVNIYECALLGLAFVLVRRAAWMRDAVILLLIETLFVADGTFMGAQTIQAARETGWAVALPLFLLAAGKGLAVLAAMQIRLSLRTAGFLLLQLLLLYVTPVVLSRASVDGVVNVHLMYAFWWIVGMLPAVYLFLRKFERNRVETSSEALVRRTLLVVPWLMLLVRVRLFQHVYFSSFILADLSPVILGLTIASLRLAPTRFIPSVQLHLLRMILAATALLFSMGYSSEMTYLLPHATRALTPPVITLMAMMISAGFTWSIFTGCISSALTLALTAGYLYGPTHQHVSESSGRVAHWIGQLVPRTATAWGVIAITAAFLFLGLGALVTLRRRPAAAARPDLPPTPAP